MKKINSKVATMLALSIISLSALIAGIPMIIIGASSSKVLMIFGIIFVAFDFYACPIMFVQYGNARALQRVVQAVVVEHIYDVQTIASHTGNNPEQITNQIRTCIGKGYITGLLFDGEKLTYNDNREAGKALLSIECKRCGAVVTYHSGETPVCPYCGSHCDENK